MELVQLGEKTYYSSGLFHVGIYVLSDETDTEGNHPVCLIDSGLDEEYAAELDMLLLENHFIVSMIINTHYHADHAGGNPYFKEKYDCRIVSSKINAALISNYDICPSIVWGASRISSISNHYFYTTQTQTTDYEQTGLPTGITAIKIPGHCIEMLAIKTSDNVIFVGDAVIAKDTIKDHALFYLYEVSAYLNSLKLLENEIASYYVPYHADPVTNISELVQINRDCVLDNMKCIKDICQTPSSIDEIYSEYYNRHGYQTSMYKYVVECSTIRSYLTHLYESGELTTIIDNNCIKWKTI